MDISNKDSVVTPVHENDLDEKTRARLLSHAIFSELSASEITSILPYFKLLKFKPNEVLVKEGVSLNKELYVILDGELIVRRAVGEYDNNVFIANHEKDFVIAKLKAGDLLGELSFLKDSPRSATIQTVSSGTVLSLEPSRLNELRSHFPKATSILMQNILAYVSERLKTTTDNEVKALSRKLAESERNAKSNIFFSYIIGLLCVYNLAIHLISKWSTSPGMASIVSACIILVFFAGSLLIIWRSKLPLKMFGLTWSNWRFALRESMIWTVIIMACMVLIKWSLITFITEFQGIRLFEFQPFEQKYMAFNFILYGLHSPVQEFIARGVLQGSLQHFFVGKNITAKAIIVSNALFAATHVHLFGGLLAVLVFITGLFWGWLYSRHQTLLGVSISHLLIGWWGLFALSFDRFF